MTRNAYVFYYRAVQVRSELQDSSLHPTITALTGRDWWGSWLAMPACHSLGLSPESSSQPG